MGIASHAETAVRAVCALVIVCVMIALLQMLNRVLDDGPTRKPNARRSTPPAS